MSAEGGTDAAVTSNWLAWPTLLETTDAWECSLTSGWSSPPGVATPVDGGLVMVQIIGDVAPATGGPVVSVMIDGVPLGSINGGRSVDYLEVIQRLGRIGLPTTCRARWSLQDHTTQLSLLGQAKLGSRQSPFLPPFDVVQVQLGEVLSDGCRLRMEEMTSDGPAQFLGTLANNSGVSVLCLDDEVIGHLEGPERPVVALALASGFHATCRAFAERKADGTLSVTVALPEGI